MKTQNETEPQLFLEGKEKYYIYFKTNKRNQKMYLSRQLNKRNNDNFETLSNTTLSLKLFDSLELAKTRADELNQEYGGLSFFVDTFITE